MRRFMGVFKWVAGVGILVVLVCGGGAAFLVPPIQKMLKEREAAAKGSMVIIEAATKGSLVRTVSAPGAVSPEATANITARVSAKIERMPFNEGDSVKEGEVLVELDSKELEASLAGSEARFAADQASLKAAEANLITEQARILGSRATYQNAVAEWERQQALFKSGDVSQSALDSARTQMDLTKSAYDSAVANIDTLKANVEAARARVGASKAEVDRAMRNVEYATIRAPYNGVITRRIANVGEVALGTISNMGGTLMVLEDQSKMLVKARLAEMDAPRVKVGQKARVYVNGFPDVVFDGVLRRIGMTVLRYTDGTMYFETEIELNTKGVRVSSGTSANVDIEIETIDDVLLAPSQAVMDKRVDSLPQKVREQNELIDSEKVFARVVFLYKDGKAVVTPVKTISSSLTRTAISAGIEVGDPVIIGPFSLLQQLTDGQRVYTEDEAKEDAPAVAEGDKPKEPGPSGSREARRESRRAG